MTFRSDSDEPEVKAPDGKSDVFYGSVWAAFVFLNSGCWFQDCRELPEVKNLRQLDSPSVESRHRFLDEAQMYRAMRNGHISLRRQEFHEVTAHWLTAAVDLLVSSVSLSIIRLQTWVQTSDTELTEYHPTAPRSQTAGVLTACRVMQQHLF